MVGCRGGGPNRKQVVVNAGWVGWILGGSLGAGRTTPAGALCHIGQVLVAGTGEHSETETQVLTVALGIVRSGMNAGAGESCPGGVNIGDGRSYPPSGGEGMENTPGDGDVMTGLSLHSLRS
jgi:hypothetical protein